MQKSEINSYTFSAPPEWLFEHSSYQPWHEGKKKLIERLNKWWKDYEPQLYDLPQHEPLNEDDLVAVKLFKCWLYHWEFAGTEKDGEEVARHVEAGNGYTSAKSLNGNPFFELVLATAFAANENRAAVCFSNSYYDYLCAVATRFNRKYASAHDELAYWWGPFCAYLLGIENAKTPVLNSYAGKSGMKCWLRIILHRFFAKKKKKEKRFPIVHFSELSSRGDTDGDSMIANFPDNKETVMDDKNRSLAFDRLVLAFRKAKETLSGKEWIRIYYFYVKRIHNKKIAVLYKETESNSTRLRQLALAKFKEAFERAVADDPVLRDLNKELRTQYEAESLAAFHSFLQEEEEGVA